MDVASKSPDYVPVSGKNTVGEHLRGIPLIPTPVKKYRDGAEALKIGVVIRKHY